MPPPSPSPLRCSPMSRRCAPSPSGHRPPSGSPLRRRGRLVAGAAGGSWRGAAGGSRRGAAGLASVLRRLATGHRAGTGPGAAVAAAPPRRRRRAARLLLLLPLLEAAHLLLVRLLAPRALVLRGARVLRRLPGPRPSAAPSRAAGTWAPRRASRGTARPRAAPRPPRLRRLGEACARLRGSPCLAPPPHARRVRAAARRAPRAAAAAARARRGSAPHAVQADPRARRAGEVSHRARDWTLLSRARQCAAALCDETVSSQLDLPGIGSRSTRSLGRGAWSSHARGGRAAARAEAAGEGRWRSGPYSSRRPRRRPADATTTRGRRGARSRRGRRAHISEVGGWPRARRARRATTRRAPGRTRGARRSGHRSSGRRAVACSARSTARTGRSPASCGRRVAPGEKPPGAQGRSSCSRLCRRA